MNTNLDALSMVGQELSEQEQDLAAGGLTVVIVYWSDGCVDVYIFP